MYRDRDRLSEERGSAFIIIIDNRGLNARWCLTLFLLSLPTAAYLVAARWSVITA